MTNSIDLDKKLSILQQWGSGEAGGIHPIQKNRLTKSALSSSQLRIWYLEQLFSGTAAYNMYICFSVKPLLDISLVNKTYKNILKRHDMMRARFVKDDDAIYQVVDECEDAKVNLIHCANVVEAEERAEKIIREPFDLFTSPLVRLSVISTPDRHLLLLTMHHIISDGWSISIFFREFSELYCSEKSGHIDFLLRDDVNYFDYIYWQNEKMKTAPFRRQVEYWRSSLGKNSGVVNISAYGRRKDRLTCPGKRIFFQIDTPLDDLRQFSRSTRTTLFVILLSCFLVLLFRHTGQYNITVGTPIANRRHKSFNSIIGFFANTLALHFNVDYSITFRELLEYVKSISNSAFSNQDVPFDSVIKEIDPNRNLNTSPLFNVAFVFQNIPAYKPEIPGFEISQLPLHNETSKFDLLLTMGVVDQKINAAFEYDSDLYSSDLVEKLSELYKNIVASAIKRDNLKINSIQLTDDVIKPSLNDSYPDGVRDERKTILDCFSDTVNQYPDSVAILWGDSYITYKELDARSTQQAMFLLQNNLIRQNDFVGVIFLSSVDLIISILSVLKAGCAYVPIDPNSPISHLSYICRNSNLSLILSHSDFDSVLSTIQVQSLFIDQSHDKIKACQGHENNCFTQHNDVAYVIYTSGSTGKPKGVMVSHHNVTRLFSATDCIYRFNNHDTFCFFHSSAFDFSVWEIWGALFHGSRLLVVSEIEKRDTKILFDVLKKNKVTVLNQTPPAFKQLSIEQSRRPSERLDHLRYVIFGGSKLDPGILRLWFEYYSDQHPKVFNMYGITETTVHVTYRQLRRDDVYLTYSPIGKPLSDLTLYVLDEALRPVSNEIVGELYVAGPGLSLGYLNNPAMTKMRFLLNPFTNKGVIYKTGDMVRLRADHELEYIGRSDGQVKVRGYRIEVGEIQGVIEEHPMIKSCLVRSFMNSSSDQELVAYLVIDENKVTLDALNDLDQLHKKQILSWNMIFDEYYITPIQDPQADFNINGWLSNYTRDPISHEEMHEWVDNVVDRVLTYRPSSVLEVGCGTGLLMSRIAPHTERYVGTDLSEKALSSIQDNIIDHCDHLNHVKLCHADANDDLGFSNTFDMIVLNSVCQYFPSYEYLINVIKKIIKYGKSTATIFIGDVRDHTLSMLFHTSVILYNADESEKVCDAIRYSNQRYQRDTELSLSPQFFYKLADNIPEVTAVHIFYKNGHYNNEMNNYRYDVMLTIGEPAYQSIEAVNFSGIEDVSQTHKIREIIHAQNEVPIISINNVQNLRISHHFEQFNLLHSMEKSESIRAIQSINEKSSIHNKAVFLELDNIAKMENRKWLLVPSALGAEYLDIIFMHSDLHLSQLMVGQYVVRDPYYMLSSKPLCASFYRECSLEIRRFLQGRLQAHMIPSKYRMIPEIPLSINGKVDEARLIPPNDNNRIPPEEVISPETETEKIVASFFCEILDVSLVGRYDDFFDLGGHSILLARVIMKLGDYFKREIPLRMLLLNPKVVDFARMLDLLIASSSDLILQESFNVDDDLQLNPDIQLPNSPLIESPSSCLLTGATGFLGVFILNELLNKTDGLVYCLVRPGKTETGWQRLQDSLHRYSLNLDRFFDRIVIIEGDLSKHYFGLSEEKFNDFSKKIGLIYHNAALVNFTYPYSLLRSSNVFGTEVILQFAALNIVKPVNFISTLYVFNDKDSNDGSPIDELSQANNFSDLHLGYTQSKWVAEKLVLTARERGIPVNIFRLGRISGDSQTGACQMKDFFWSIVRLGIKMKCLPQWDYPIDLFPVDVACRAIVLLSNNSDYNHQFHINNPSPASPEVFFSTLNNMGYTFNIVPIEEWKRIFYHFSKKHQLDDEASSLVPLLGSSHHRRINFDSSATIEAMKKLSIEVPEVSELLALYCGYFKSHSYFNHKGE